jgi:peptide-methionine (S)-S-oxide reductase
VAKQIAHGSAHGVVGAEGRGRGERELGAQRRRRGEAAQRGREDGGEGVDLEQGVRVDGQHRGTIAKRRRWQERRGWSNIAPSEVVPMWFASSSKLKMPAKEDALPGRSKKMPVPAKHFILGSPLEGPFEGKEQAIFGMGCFWGAERKFWKLPGMFTTAVGYAAGFTPNPTYEEVCSGRTGHNEVVLAVFDPKVVRYEDLLKVFWESHDPTQGMAQGNDQGTQYRSGIYTFGEAQKQAALASREAFQQALRAQGFGDITTEIIDAPTFYYAEDYHQQYLGKNPNGYCGLGGTGVSCPIGLGT